MGLNTAKQSVVILGKLNYRDVDYIKIDLSRQSRLLLMFFDFCDFLHMWDRAKVTSFAKAVSGQETKSELHVL